MARAKSLEQQNHEKYQQWTFFKYNCDISQAALYKGVEGFHMMSSPLKPATWPESTIDSTIWTMSFIIASMITW